MTTLLLLLDGSLVAGIRARARAGTASPLGVLAWQRLFGAATLTASARNRCRPPLHPTPQEP